MTIYVDDAIFPWRGALWGHLFCEDLEELHDFAAHLGLRRERFQHPPHASWPHYDVTAQRRIEAIALGAVAADRYLATEIALKIRFGHAPQTWEERLALLRQQRRSSCPSVTS